MKQPARQATGWFIAAILAGVTALGARPAQAKGVLGVDANLAHRFGDGSDFLSTGYGFNIRAGLGLPLPFITLELGALFRYNHWSLDRQGFSGGQSSKDLLAGGRIGVGAFIHPWVAFYLGYGNMSSDSGPVGGVATSEGHGGTALLVGGGVDIKFAMVAVGVHLDYNKDVVDAPMGGKDASQWMSFGLNLTLSF